MANSLNKITTKSILDATVATADIADDAVTEDKLANAINTSIAGKAVLTGSTNNTITTVTGANAIQGEAKLTFDGSTLAQSITSNGEGITLTAAGNHYTSIKGDADRTGAGNTLLNLQAAWDGTEVASIAMGSGDDTTNKDDGILRFFTATSGSSSAERVRIDSSGKVGIGTDSPTVNTQIQSSGTNSLLKLAGTTSGSGINDGLDVGINGSDGILWNRENGTLQLATNNTERLRIDSDGKLKIGTTATPTQSGALNVFGTDDTTSQVSIRRGSGNSGGPTLHFQKNRNTADDSHTVVLENDVLGQIVFAGNDGAGPENGARIKAEVDSTPGGNDMPGRLVFSTTSDGSDALTERMRINSSGAVTKPTQPGCTVTGPNQWTTINSNNTTIPLLTGVQHNIGSHYNTSTGKFTCPVAGRYLVSFNAYTDSNEDNDDANSKSQYMYFVVNDSGIGKYHGIRGYGNAGDNDGTMSMSFVIELSANDTVSPQIGASGYDVRWYGGHTTFSVILLA